MRIISVTAENFGSYESLGVDFSGAGLSLVYGATGSGKSTLPDVVTWGLFGCTAKDGNVDDVRSWHANGQATKVILATELSDGAIIVVSRIRGRQSENDLFWQETADGEPIRGKDLTDTQKLLSKRLGVGSDVFIAGSYYHEFSPTGAFFTAKAKERRALFEKIAPLDLPSRVAEASTGNKKAAKALATDLQRKHDRLEGQVSELQSAITRTADSAKGWDKEHLDTLNRLASRMETFDAERDKQLAALQVRLNSEEFRQLKEQEDLILDDIQLVNEQLTGLRDTRCEACGNRTSSNEIIELQAMLALRREDLRGMKERQSRHKRLLEQVEQVKALKNDYLERLEEATAQVNPFHASGAKAKAEFVRTTRLLETVKASLADAENSLRLLNKLYDLSFELRGLLLENVVGEIQDATNAYLGKYFDSELKVTFSMADEDNLEVAIQKSGFDCSFKQLSKGQRCLLKLCFSVSVMTATSNKAGVHFENLFFDEALDGLDADLKVKAFQLFEELSKDRGSVLVVEHSSEFQTLFDNRYHVSLVDDRSVIEHE